MIGTGLRPHLRRSRPWNCNVRHHPAHCPYRFRLRVHPIQAYRSAYHISSNSTRSSRTRLMVKKLSHQPLVGFGIAAALHQHVENETILIDSPPKPAFLSADRNHNFIEITFSPSRLADRLRISSARCRPNFSAHRRTV